MYVFLSLTANSLPRRRLVTLVYCSICQARCCMRHGRWTRHPPLCTCHQFLPNMANKLQGDDNHPKCSQCERTGQQCCRTKGLRKFRDGSSAQYEKQFSKDQVWLGLSKKGRSRLQLAVRVTGRSAMVALMTLRLFANTAGPIAVQPLLCTLLPGACTIAVTWRLSF